MNKEKDYDCSKDFSPEELYEEQPEKEYQTIKERLSEIGMSIHDFM